MSRKRRPERVAGAEPARDSPLTDRPPDGADASGGGRVWGPAFAWAPLLILYAVIPWPAVKFLAGAALMLSFGAIPGLNRSRVMALLGALFAVAYLLSPYYLIPATARIHALGPLIGKSASDVLCAALLIAIGAVWAWLAAGDFPGAARRQWRPFLWSAGAAGALAVAVLGLNCAALHNIIPAQGDEIFHIQRARLARTILAPLFAEGAWPVTVLAAALVAGLMRWPRWPPLPVKALALVTLGVAVCLATGFYSRLGQAYASFVSEYLPRYPFALCWLDAVGLTGAGEAFEEGLFRMVPLLSVFGVAWFAVRALRAGGAGWGIALTGALALCATPNLHYHATILYLELPAVALMLVAFYHIEPILREDFKTARATPGWLALMAAGFLKDNLLIVILGIAGLRLVTRGVILGRGRRGSLREIGNEAAAAFCILAPIAVYVILRTQFSGARPYRPALANLFHLEYYSDAARALWAQFGGVLIVAAAGAIALWMSRRFLALGAVLLLGLAHFFFHFLDAKTDFIGLARFNLFLFPALSVLTLWFLQWLAGRWRRAALAVAAGCLGLNLWLSPVSILTGDKIPTWGAPRSIGSCEFYFPYREAADWIAKNRPRAPVVVGGAHYDTSLGIYFQKAGLRPPPQLTMKDSETYAQGLAAALQNAGANGIGLVLFHKMRGGPDFTDEEKNAPGWRVIQTFQNRYLGMALFEKIR